jgi:hypothetical protein
MASSDVSSVSEVFSIREFFESMQEDNIVIQDIPDQNERNTEGKLSEHFKKFKFSP